MRISGLPGLAHTTDGPIVRATHLTCGHRGSNFAVGPRPGDGGDDGDGDDA